MFYPQGCSPCYHKGLEYSCGAIICNDALGRYEECDNGEWVNAGLGSCFSDLNICADVGSQPNWIPSPPIQCYSINSNELYSMRNHWTYIWTYNRGETWIYVKEIGWDPYYGYFINGCVWYFVNNRWQKIYVTIWHKEMCAYYIY